MNNYLRQLMDVLDQIYTSAEQQGQQQAAQQQMGPPLTRQGIAPPNTPGANVQNLQEMPLPQGQLPPLPSDMSQRLTQDWRGDPDVGPPRPAITSRITPGQPQIGPQVALDIGQPIMPGQPQVDVGMPQIEPPAIAGLHITKHPDGRVSVQVPEELAHKILGAPRKKRTATASDE